METKICYITTYNPPKDCNICEPKEVKTCVVFESTNYALDDARKAFEKLASILQLQNYEPYRKL